MAFNNISKIKDYMKYAFENFKHRKLRSWLTMIGIFIGIAAVVSLISLGQGLQGAINAQFQAIGSDKIMIMPGSSMASSIGSQAAELKDGDLNVIRKTPGVKRASGMVYKAAKVEFRGESKYTFVIGMPTGQEDMQLWDSISTYRVLNGRSFRSDDKYVAEVGYLIWNSDFFKKTAALGDKMTINGVDFRITGEIDMIGNNADDSQIYIPMDTAKEIFGIGDRYDMMIAQSVDIPSTNAVADSVEKRLRKYRNQKENQEDFTVQSTDQMLETYGSILNIIQAVIIGIACISLFVGGIGIMNTMYTAVLERTNEIGVMKAIGARNSDIISLFLIESGLLGLVGGLVGILIGVGFSSAVSFIANNVLKTMYFQAAYPPFLIIGSMLFSFLVGSLSGLTPAIQASKLKPVDALRYE